MSMPTEAVEALHTITAELKEEHERKAGWLQLFDTGIKLESTNEEITDCRDGEGLMPVTRAEAELIFANRIAAHEGKLKELGWERKIRVESPPVVIPMTIPHTQT